MNLQPPLKDRLITAVAYLFPVFLSGPLLSIDAALTVGVVLFFYFLMRKQSRFVFHHVRQNVNLILSYYVYSGIITLFVFLFERSLTLGGGGIQAWISEQVMLQPFILFAGILSPIFFMLLLQLLLYIALFVLILQVLLGKWTRVPLIIPVFKKDMDDLYRSEKGE